MSIVTIYRLEHKDGEGFYQGRTGFSIEHDFRRHPLPHQDSLLMESLHNKTGMAEVRGQHFGFRDIDQLRAWVYQDDWLRALEHHGVWLAEIHIDEGFVCYGNTQTVFDRSRIQRTIHHNILDYFQLRGTMSRNDITGDNITTKPSTDAFRNNYDTIFRKDKKEIVEVQEHEVLELDTADAS